VHAILLNGWTLLLGSFGTVLTVVGFIWRKRSPASGSSLFRRLAQTVSAIYRLQLAEGDLDAANQSLLRKDQIVTDLREQVADDRKELEWLREEIERMRGRSGYPESSQDTRSFEQSSDSFTGPRGARIRKKRTTSGTSR
jgi:hypothetical protein